MTVSKRTIGVTLLFIALGCATAPTAGSGTVTAATATATVEVEAGIPAVACTPRETGPFAVPFASGAKRNVFFVAPHATTCDAHPQRLIANLHGLCNPPGYACGYWTGAASDRGFLVCPEGNSTCGPGGPPTWDEGFDAMDKDLEHAIDDVSALYPGEVEREGAVLTGFSRGAYAAPFLAQRHPGRWTYLVLVEADVPLDAATLRRSGVKAVALLAGEYGSQIAGERATAVKLKAQGFPARFWTMSKAGHYYSADIDALMGEAIDWAVSQS
jgi:hypothetical protein